MKNCKVIAIFALVIIFLVGYMPVCFGVDVLEANNVINQAELKLSSAFVAVADADNVGANVATLLSKLNAGGVFLFKAHLSYRIGDYDAASFFALECANSIEKVTIEADQLKADAERTRNDLMFLNLVGSGIGLVMLVILGIICWRVLRKRYFKQVLDKRPEMEAT